MSSDTPSKSFPAPALPTQAHDEVDVVSQAALRNLEVAMSLRGTAWRLAEAGVRTFRPDLSEEAVQDTVRAQFRRTAG